MENSDNKPMSYEAMMTRIVDLEIQIAHLTHTVDELNDETVRQGEIITYLSRKIKVLLEKSAEVDEMLAARPSASQKPPHW